MSELDAAKIEFMKELLRPVDIKEDVILMKQRQRVSKILKSEAFHKELNKILDQQLKEGSVCGGKAGSATEAAAYAALQEISNLLLPQARLGSSVFNRDAKMPIVPINDIKSTDKAYTKQEKMIRCKLASIYRLVDLHGWASGMVMHGSVRLTKDEDEFLTTCHGFMNHEIQASTLIKVNSKGESLDDNEVAGILDSSTWTIHSKIHSADPIYRCVLHVRTPSAVAVSCMKSGLQQVCEESMKLGDIIQNTKLSELSDRLQHQSDCHCILLRNQGIWTRGRTIEEAWHYLKMAVHSCEVQVRLASGRDNTQLNNGTSRQTSSNSEDDEEITNNYLVEFEALMRALDSTGHRTGHMYRFAPITIDQHHHKSSAKKSMTDDGNLADVEGDDDDDDDVEVPPSATSFSTKKTEEDSSISNGTGIRGPQDPKWLVHMPNDYVRVESEEPGPQSNKRRVVVTWQQLPPDARNTSGLVETCQSANQFAPLGTDPNELKQQQMKVKSKYFNDLTTAGHQSKVLKGLEKDAKDGSIVSPASASQPGESDDLASGGGRVVLVGAVSKGIIDKKHRKDPSVYQSCFSPNPFDRVTEEELKQYERKVYGLPDDQENYEANNATSPSVNVTEAPDVVSDLIEAKSSNVQESIPHDLSHEEITSKSEAGPSSGGMLSPTGTKQEQLRSDTSGPDLSHDDTEKEGQKSTGGKKKRKKLKEMFSFRKKDKSK